MSINTNQKAFHNFISRKLNENSYNVPFETDLFNSDLTRYYKVDENGKQSRFVPTMISDIVGEYINVPNANSTSNDASIAFDVFVGTQDNSDKYQEEFQNVTFENTMNAIEEFKNSLLAQYFPLGDAILYMGGEDSTAEFELTTPFTCNYIKLNLVPLNNDEDTEYILKSQGTEIEVYKFYDEVDEKSYIKVSLNDGVALLEVEYLPNVENEITIYNDDDTWYIENSVNGSLDSVESTFTFTESKYILGDTNGLEAKIKRIRIGSDSDYSQVDINTWNSDTEITNNGDTPFIETSINNCILWSEEGNAIFGFGTLNPVTDIEPRDGKALYQTFELEISVFISNDVLFGNNFKYYLDDVQVYPVDRGLTLGTQDGASQYINNDENEYIIEESTREHTMSFYYIPSKKLTKLFKHVAKGGTSQNDTYTLTVQYPFFKVDYNVLINGGGTNPNINALSTFSITLKKVDSKLVGD